MLVNGIIIHHHAAQVRTAFGQRDDIAPAGGHLLFKAHRLVIEPGEVADRGVHGLRGAGLAVGLPAFGKLALPVRPVLYQPLNAADPGAALPQGTPHPAGQLILAEQVADILSLARRQVPGSAAAGAQPADIVGNKLFAGEAGDVKNRAVIFFFKRAGSDLKSGFYLLKRRADCLICHECSCQLTDWVDLNGS